MSDFLLKLAENPGARRLVERAGLPIPLPERLRRADGPWEERPLDGVRLVYAAAPGGAMAEHLAPSILGAGAHVTVVGGGANALAFQKARTSGAAPLREVVGSGGLDVAPDAIVFDATGIESAEGLAALYEAFHPVVGRVARSGRVVVLRRSAGSGSVVVDAARAAIEGFVRSLAKELGKRGATANVVAVDAGAEGRAAAVAMFLLSARSAFVTGQPLTVGLAVQGDAPARAPRSLAGKVALVTGAARGIGAATARILAAEGACVACLDRPADGAAVSQLAREIAGGAVVLDLADASAPETLAEALTKSFGGVDIVVHNAGITRDKTLARMSEDQWASVVGVNLAAVLRTTDALVGGPLRDGGRVVALSSIAGLAGNVGQTNYAASKAGVAGFVRALAPVLAPRGITVNAVAPGFIETRLTAAIPFAIREAGRRMSSLGQGGQPEDVGEVVTFLSTPAAVGLTGQVLRVCGGSLVGA
jgi:3-oxoacyl-[acyl-carrier protein] reductase